MKRPLRPVLWSVLLALLGLLAALSCLGCLREQPLRLIEVSDVAPREIEVGDRLEIRGAGFAQGRTAHLTFRGSLHRPGRPAERASVRAEGTVTSVARVDVPVSEALLAEFAGTGERADHTTFRGDVEVAFASHSSNAPPIVGILRDVVLDVWPASMRQDVATGRTREGERILDALGLSASPAPGGGLLVKAVAPGSRADDTGLVQGDLITGFDQVRISSFADLATSGARKARISFRRGDGPREEVREISMVGLAGTLPPDFSWVLRLLALAALSVVAFVAPFEGRASRVELALASRVRKLRERASLASLWRDLSRGLLGAKPTPQLAWLPVAILLVASATLFVLPGGEALVAQDFDLLLLFVASATATLTVAFLRERSFTGRVKGALLALLLQVPPVLALVAAVVMTGSLRGGDAVRGQGSLPWEWNAFRSPSGFLLAIAWIAAQISLGAPKHARKHDPGHAREAAPRGSFGIDIAERIALLFSSGVLSLLYLGGYRLPFSDEHPAGAARLVGGALLVAKAWTVLALILLARWGLPRLALGQLFQLATTRLLPLSALAFAAALAWSRWHGRFELESTVGLVLALSTGVFMVRLLVRIRFVSETPTPHVDPFV